MNNYSEVWDEIFKGNIEQFIYTPEEDIRILKIEDMPIRSVLDEDDDYQNMRVIHSDYFTAQRMTVRVPKLDISEFGEKLEVSKNWIKLLNKEGQIRAIHRKAKTIEIKVSREFTRTILIILGY